jgi:hypothetical protein
MRLPAVIYLLDEEPILGELDGLPVPAAQFVTVHHARRRDGRGYFPDSPNDTVLIAWHRIRAVQMLPQGGTENVIGFVRE